jgi:hypothetical protein
MAEGTEKLADRVTNGTVLERVEEGRLYERITLKRHECRAPERRGVRRFGGFFSCCDWSEDRHSRAPS